MTPGELLTAALRYAELGYRVFPCWPGSKKPVTEHGFHDASTDAAQIEKWWSRHPTANIGIAAEGMLVVDIDGADNPWPGDPERAA
ncbi:MAG: bifunctional DNA primase/polymerase, partial [Fimbriimonadaceae bacterium]